VAGKAGRSGRKPMSVLEHRLRGTFRADRHGSLAARARSRSSAPRARWTLAVAVASCTPFIASAIRIHIAAGSRSVWLRYPPSAICRRSGLRRRVTRASDSSDMLSVYWVLVETVVVKF
jgi:hypothetical protein